MTFDIPCRECDAKKAEIELDGLYKVVSCDPIPGHPDWCRITAVRSDSAPAPIRAP